MKKTLLTFALILFGHIALFAQSPTSIQCVLTIDQISEAQPYDVDHPKQEETREIAANLITELGIVYDLVNQGNTNLSSHINSIEASVGQATVIGMNYSMFQADLDFIETLN
ncbi:MAG: hypothetical protein P8P74_17850 [Crocinitomicaceae bacterium]|nr:hypothetical protein [Crocinitomicaceae bacterium]